MGPWGGLQLRLDGLAEQTVLLRLDRVERAYRLQQRRQNDAEHLDEKVSGAGVFWDEGHGLLAEGLTRLDPAGEPRLQLRQTRRSAPSTSTTINPAMTASTSALASA